MLRSTVIIIQQLGEVMRRREGGGGGRGGGCGVGELRRSRDKFTCVIIKLIEEVERGGKRRM